MKRTGDDRIFVLPNIITSARILGTPAVTAFIIAHEWRTAFWILLGIAVTDKLDGLAAVWFNQRTRLGRILDPTVDYFMLAGVTLGVLVSGPWWLRAVALAVMGRMVLVGRLAMGRRLHDEADMAVNEHGKIAMVLSCFALGAFVLYHSGADRLFLGFGLAALCAWAYFGATSLKQYRKAESD